MNNHYTLEEILALEKKDEHINSCNICYEIFKQKEKFWEIIKRENEKLSKIKNNLFSIEKAKKMLQELEKTKPSLRIPKIIKRNFLCPYLILEICKKIKMLYFSSPRQAREWLNIGFFLQKELEEKYQKEINFEKGFLYLVSGNLKLFQGKLKEALDDFRFSLKLFEKEKDDFKRAFVIRSMLFPLNFKLEFGEAFSLSLEALKIFRDHGAEREKYYLWNNIGLVYLKEKKVERAEKIFNLLLQKLPENDPYYSLIYHNALLVKMHKKEYEEVLKRIGEFQKMAKNAKLSVERGRSYIIEGEVNIYLKDFSKAIKSFKKARRFLKGNSLNFDEALINIGLAKSYFELKMPDKALLYLKKAQKFFSSEGFVEELQESISLWEKGIILKGEDVGKLSSLVVYKLVNLYHFGVYYPEV